MIAGWIAWIALAQGPASASELKNMPALRRTAVGDRYRVDIDGRMGGFIHLLDQTGKPVKRDMRGPMQTVFVERCLRADDRGRIDQTFRVYRKVEYKRTVGDQPQSASLREKVSRVLFFRDGDDRVAFSPDGAMQWAELDLVRDHLFLPQLETLFPEREIALGDAWEGKLAGVAALTDLAPIEKSELRLKLIDRFQHNGRWFWRVTLEGKVEGYVPDGRCADSLSGALFVDVVTGRLHSGRITGLRRREGRESWDRQEVEIVFTFKVDHSADTPELANERIGKLPAAMTPDLLLVEYEQPFLGVTLPHPRNWIAKPPTAAQMVFEIRAAPGSRETLGSVVINKEDQIAELTMEKYLDRVRAGLRAAGFDVVAKGAPQEQRGGGRIGFANFEGTKGTETLRFNCWLLERPAGGVTATARCKPADLERISEEVEQVLRRMTLTAPLRNDGVPPEPKP
jgi:hypothetical protein